MLYPMRYVRKVKKLIDWFPLIWKDEDWDYAYLLTLIGYKLKRMRECIHSNDVIAHAENVANEILEAEIMIRNIADDPDDEWSLHYNQWHSCKSSVSEPCQAEGECRKTLELSAKRSEKNWHKLWKHLDKYSQGWWD